MLICDGVDVDLLFGAVFSSATTSAFDENNAYRLFE